MTLLVTLVEAAAQKVYRGFRWTPDVVGALSLDELSWYASIAPQQPELTP